MLSARTIPRENSENISKLYVYLISMVAAAGGLLMGYHLVIIAGAILFLKKTFHLNPTEVGFAVSSAAIGCLIGPLVAGRLVDQLGRKWSLSLTGVVFGVAAIGTALSTNMVTLNAFRIFGGVGVGMASVVSPMYLAEISPAQLRGRLVTLNQVTTVGGGLISITVAYLFAPSESWRWMFALQVIPSLLLLLGLAFVPESPRWLVQKGQVDKARSILAQINGAKSGTEEVQEITRSISFVRQEPKFVELFRPGMRLPLMIAVVLGIFQQWTGAGTLFLYAPIIFQMAGVERAEGALMQTIVLNLWNLACTFIAFWLVDRAGRRPLLLGGTAGMTGGFVLLGAVFYFGMTGWYVLLVMLVCVGSYAVSLGPLVWLIMSEIFPNRLRGRAVAVGSICVWLSLFVANQVFAPFVSYLNTAFGTAAGAFWVFAVVCGTAFLFSWRVVPETKGRSLEEIAKSWAGSQNISNSA